LQQQLRLFFLNMNFSFYSIAASMSIAKL